MDTPRLEPRVKELIEIHLFAKGCYGYGLLTIQQLNIVWELAHGPIHKLKAQGKYKSIFESDLERIANGWRDLHGRQWR